MKKLFFSTAFLCAFVFSGKSQVRLNQRVPMHETAPSQAAVNDDGTLKEAPAKVESKPAAENKKTDANVPKKEAATAPKKEEKATKPH